MHNKTKSFLLAAATFIFLASGSVMAQTGFGIRAGASVDPDQFHFGAHYITDDLIEQLHFRPNLEIGIGNDVTSVTANFEFAYRIPIRKSDYSAYIGAGPALNVYRISREDFSDTSVKGGFNILLGLEHKSGFFGELKVGAIHSPDLKFTIGYTFSD